MIVSRVLSWILLERKIVFDCASNALVLDVIEVWFAFYRWRNLSLRMRRTSSTVSGCDCVECPERTIFSKATPLLCALS